jgi:hypothetical protein
VFPLPNAVVIVPAVLGAAGGLIVAVRKALDVILADSSGPAPAPEDRGPAP